MRRSAGYRNLIEVVSSPICNFSEGGGYGSEK